MLTRDLEQFPASALDSLQRIRQRMVDARDALIRVRTILLGLGRLAKLAAEIEGEPAPVTTESRGIAVPSNAVRPLLHQGQQPAP